MGIEMGRVSGPLLSENLLRNGEDLAFETNLLYLDVNNNKIGIKNDAPTRQLSVADARTSYLVVDTQADIANFSILTNKIQNPLGTIYLRPNQTTDPTIKAPELQTANLSFTNQKIENLTVDSNIELNPNGTGIVKFTTSTVNIDGTLHATGDVTWDGTITFGNNNLDSVTFNTDITSSIIPDNSTYGLGSLSKYWQTLYTRNVTATNITSSSDITINSINLALSSGKTIYVSTTGNDTLSGMHAHAPFKTIKAALAIATVGDEVVIFPGTYTEIFPLTIPLGVSVRGMSIRAVVIKPTIATNNKDAFLLNGDTTVSFLTIQDYFFDIVNNTGYAFRFANNFKSLVKSPYIQNVTIISKGSVTPTNDPLGFNQGDAGAGILVDSTDADLSGNIVPSLLCYAVTLITPNQDSIVAKNNVRVEWLNSFTYYAKRGSYLTNGAEFRSINSANIYGTYGVVADGTNTRGYLTGHNFSYVGSGNISSNDKSNVFQENEIVATNDARIFYDSMDHKGDFRVGDIFYVNQETGQVVFNAQHIDFGATGGLVFETEYGVTNINMTAIQTGNIRIHDNDIDSLVGPVNFLAASTSTYLNTNVYVTGLLDVTGETNVKGNVFLGNEVLDTLTIFPRLTQTFKPKTTSTYTLGTSDVSWKTAFLTGLNVDNVTQITNNTISTISTDTDLRLVAAGTGKIQISSTDVAVSNNLTAVGTTTIDGDTSLRNVNISGLVELTGDINQTGNIRLTGTLHNTDNLIITGSTSYLRSNGVKILNNQIYTNTSGDTLSLSANGTGGVVFDDKIKFTNTTISNRWSIATTNLQKSIVLTPSGTGLTVINSTEYLKLPYSNETTNYLSAVGQIRHNSTTNLYEGYNIPDGLESFTNLYDTDRNTYITPELTPGANDNTLRFGINNTVVAEINSSRLFSNLLEIDDIHILNNTITTALPNTDFFLTPNGSSTSINVNNLVFKPNNIMLNTNQVLTMQGTSAGYFKFGGTFGLVIPIGDNSQRRVDPEIGETRFNTEIQIWEVFNGTIWDSAIGSASFATSDEVDDIMNTWAIILG
jgi:hypothetical protein